MHPAAFCDRYFCIADHNAVAQNRIACRDTAQGYLVSFGNGIDQRKAVVELRPGEKPTFIDNDGYVVPLVDLDAQRPQFTVAGHVISHSETRYSKLSCREYCRSAQ